MIIKLRNTEVNHSSSPALQLITIITILMLMGMPFSFALDQAQQINRSPGICIIILPKGRNLLSMKHMGSKGSLGALRMDGITSEIIMKINYTCMQLLDGEIDNKNPLMSQVN